MRSSKSARSATSARCFFHFSCFPWIGASFAHFVPHTLYFDPINYQYTAWCIRHGERLYDTVGVPDGPFITMLHAAVQTLVGESDAAFRRADSWIHTLGSMAMGVVLAPVAGPGRRSGPRRWSSGWSGRSSLRRSGSPTT